MARRRGRARMTAAEVRRYAHGLAAEWLQRYLARGAEPFLLKDIEPRVVRELEKIAEQHARYGPKAGDFAPVAPAPHTTPLLDALDREPVHAGKDGEA